MSWSVEFSRAAEQELGRLDPQHTRRILKFLQQRVAKLDDPRSIGQALQGARFGEFWKYRVDNYRLICKLKLNARLCWCFVSDIVKRSIVEHTLTCSPHCPGTYYCLSVDIGSVNRARSVAESHSETATKKVKLR